MYNLRLQIRHWYSTILLVARVSLHKLILLACGIALCSHRKKSRSDWYPQFSGISPLIWPYDHPTITPVIFYQHDHSPMIGISCYWQTHHFLDLHLHAMYWYRIGIPKLVSISQCILTMYNSQLIKAFQYPGRTVPFLPKGHWIRMRTCRTGWSTQPAQPETARFDPCVTKCYTSGKNE